MNVEKSKIVIGHSRNLLFLFLHSNVKSFTHLPKEQTQVRYSTVQQIKGLKAREKGNILTSIKGQQDNNALCFQQRSQREQFSIALRGLQMLSVLSFRGMRTISGANLNSSYKQFRQGLSIFLVNSLGDFLHKPKEKSYIEFKHGRTKNSTDKYFNIKVSKNHRNIMWQYSVGILRFHICSHNHSWAYLNIHACSNLELADTYT